MTQRDEIAKLRQQLLIQSKAATDNEKIFLRLLERSVLMAHVSQRHLLLQRWGRLLVKRLNRWV